MSGWRRLLVDRTRTQRVARPAGQAAASERAVLAGDELHAARVGDDGGAVVEAEHRARDRELGRDESLAELRGEDRRVLDARAVLRGHDRAPDVGLVVDVEHREAGGLEGAN